MTQDHAQTYLTRPWLTHYEAGVPHEFHSSDRVMPDLLRENARDYGSRPAVSFLGASLNYTQLWQQVQALAAALQKSGVQPGDRVAIMLPNLPQFVVSFYGALLAGAVVVNTSPLYVADELAHQLQDSGASTLIILDSLLPRYLEVQGGVPVKRVFVARVEDALAFPKNLLYPIKQRLEKQHVKVPWSDHILPLRSVIASQKGAPQPVTLRPDDVALLQYTGGTTGLPKGAMLTHRNLIANAEQAWSWFSELKKGEEVGLGAIPYFHVYGMTASMNLNILGAGHTVLVPNPRDLKMVLSEIQRTKPSLFPAVPTLYNAINHYPDISKYDLSSIKACISGSAPLPLETARTFKEITRGANLVEGYGLTESSPITHVNPVSSEQREGSIGLPLPGVDAMVMDDDAQPVPLGETGELWVSGPMVMKGYWNRSEETAKVLRDYAGKTWLLTGDVARMDEAGYFYIVDRKKDLIIASGYNIYPREVEEVLFQHPAVLEAAVVGVPDEYRGESVHAVVVFREGQEASEKELIGYCREHLSPYKAPRSVEVRAELPKTAVGKVLRRQLREEVWTRRSG
ncbi:long-chain-fatty-acid--CoA ligase [Deinococcus radiophilus]|uniref:Long-chain fatty acid--CoA ligase n=1 Tax=Deinococcus radiophilus TaxID=32062 RepID=A0A431W0G1_9DEIO|nr:long-chain fatty acid--CoA ligase [Deinococcus radiophilus]RTR28619.1 long-chain fatty acid--CoA ligase [Deinococcus radiophilus]UFA51041.1 long-chain fatty acid--CoA ligase [Deinococcus radiophilus]